MRLPVTTNKHSFQKKPWPEERFLSAHLLFSYLPIQLRPQGQYPCSEPLLRQAVESSVTSRPLQGFPTVLLVHPSQCTVSTSAWGKGRGLRASFPTWGQRESVPDLHMPSPLCVAASVRVWGGPADQCDSPDPGSFQWSRTSAVFPLPGSLQRPRLYYFS